MRSALMLFALLPVVALAQAEELADDAAPHGVAEEKIAPVVASSGTEGTLIYNFGQHPVVSVADGTILVTAENSTIAPKTGYMPLQVYVRNVGKEAELVRLEFTYRGSVSAAVRRDVTVPHGGRASVTLPVPAGANHGTLTAKAKGITEGGNVSLYFTPANQAILAIGTEEQFQKRARRAPDYNSYNIYVRTMAPEDAPSELPSYVGFNEVVLLVPLDELSEATRRALEGYAATGGTLIVTRPSRALMKELPLLPKPDAGLHDYGFGSVRVCGKDALACANALNTDLSLAQRVVKPSGAFNLTSRGAYDSYGNIIPDNERFLLPQATAPVGRFLLIILAFTLAIGPGSVWVARRRGPPMLLLTIPATALVTCLLIVGYSVIVDGFSIHAATRGFTLLDSKNKRAISVGVEAFYANIAPGKAAYDLNTVLLSPAVDYNPEQLASVDWTNGATFETDFIPSRTYREWGLVTVSPTRARLVVKKRQNGELELQNALGSELRTARVRIDQREYIVRDVRDGGSRTLEPWPISAEVPESTLNTYASRFDARVGTRVKRALEEGEFIAHVAGPSLLPQGGLRLSHHSSEQLIRGEVER